MSLIFRYKFIIRIRSQPCKSRLCRKERDTRVCIQVCIRACKTACKQVCSRSRERWRPQRRWGRRRWRSTKYIISLSEKMLIERGFIPSWWDSSCTGADEALWSLRCWMDLLYTLFVSCLHSKEVNYTAAKGGRGAPVLSSHISQSNQSLSLVFSFDPSS